MCHRVYFWRVTAIYKIIDKFQITGVQKTTLAKYDLYVKLSRTYPNAIEVMQEIDEYLLTLKKNPKIN